LAAVDPKEIQLLSAALEGAGESAPTIVAHLDVAELSRLAPGLLIADLDRLEVDPLEMLRQLRFVLPDSVVAVYTNVVKLSWARDCHIAGANCLLSKASRESQLISGLQHAIQGGCFTDPRFVA
jgi:DNA-binding NarL/FixJ family response regulator